MNALQLEDRFCTLCGPSSPKNVKYPANFSEGDLNAEIFSARRQPDRRHFRLVECGQCGIIYSDPACDPATLGRLYQASTVDYGNQEEQIFESYAPVLDRGLKLLPEERRKRFVEVGGGRGFMLKYGQTHGFSELIEIEPSSDAEKRFKPYGSNSRFVRGIFDDKTLPDGSASLICFFQMLDHVPNPGEFVRNIFRALQPGGVAVCVTHNTHALSARVLGERSPIFDIEHTYLFNPQSMSQLFAKSGFEKMDTFTVANNYALRHWMHLAPLPKPAKRRLIPLAEKLKLADLRLKLRAGNFGIVARKPG